MLEPIGRFFEGRGSKEGSLQRLFMAQKISTAIAQELTQNVRVVVKLDQIIIRCADPTAAYALKLKKRRVDRIVQSFIKKPLSNRQIKITSHP